MVGTGLVLDERASASVHVLTFGAGNRSDGKPRLFSYSVCFKRSKGTKVSGQVFPFCYKLCSKNRPLPSVCCTLTVLHSTWTQRWPKNYAAFPISSTATHNIHIRDNNNTHLCGALLCSSLLQCMKVSVNAHCYSVFLRVNASGCDQQTKVGFCVCALLLKLLAWHYLGY